MPINPPRPASIYQAFSRIVAGARRGRIPIRTVTFSAAGNSYADWIESLPLAPLTKSERQSYSLPEE